MGRKKSKDNGFAKALLIIGGLIGLFIVFAFYIDESLGAWWQIEVNLFGKHYIYYNMFGMTAKDDFTLRLELLGLFAGIIFILGSIFALIAARKESKGISLLSLVSIFGGLFLFCYAINTVQNYDEIVDFLNWITGRDDYNVFFGEYSIWTWRLGNGFFIGCAAGVLVLIGMLKI